MEFARKCDKCQWFVLMSKAHPKELTTMTSLWSFVIWGIDLIGKLPKGRGSSRLLHQVGRSRGIPIHHTRKDQGVRI